MNLKRKMRKGFTLVELVIVIAVIAILAAVSVGAYFGVTDSANSSAADQTNKQVRDLWVMYSVGEYKDNSSVYDNATDFCLRYFEENGQGDVDINFKTGDESKGEILLKIETTYPTYIYIEDKKIVEYSGICKSEETFVEAVSSSELVADSFKNDQPFEIETIDYNGEKVRGFTYYQTNIYGLEENKSSTLFVKNGLSVLEGNDESLVNSITPDSVNVINSSTSGVISYGSSFDIYSYDNEVKGAYFDVNKKNLFEINGDYDTKIYQGKDYSYIIDEIDLLYVRNQINDNLDIINYPVCFAFPLYSTTGGRTTSKYVFEYFKTFEDYFEYKGINQNVEGFYNVNPLEDTTVDFGTAKKVVPFIFLGNTYISKNINFINCKIIADYSSNIDGFKDYIKDIYYGNESYFETIYRKNTKVKRMFASTVDSLENTRAFNEVSKVVINAGTTVNLISSQLSIEAELGVPLGEGSVKPGFETVNSSQLINHGTIHLDGTSKFRSLGLTSGEGKIMTSSGSNIYEVFKLLSEQGTGEGNLNTNIENKYFVFPVYQMDAIRCEVEIVSGAKHNLISPIVATISRFENETFFISSCTTFIGNDADNPLFSIERGSISKKFNEEKNRSVIIINENSNVHDSVFSVSIDPPAGYESLMPSISMSNDLFNFSISNLEVIISNNSSLSLQSNGIYELNPFSKFEIKEGGILNINSGELGVLNFTEAQYNEMLTASVSNRVQQTIFNKYKSVDTSSMFINNGTINIGNGAILCFADRTNVEFGVINDLDQTNFSKYTYKYLTGPVSYGNLELEYWRDQTTN